MVEGRHFRRDWASAEDVGHRAAAQNLSDLNAMGGRAHSLTVGLAAPADLPVRWAMEFAAGFAAECELVGASVVGGDLTSRGPGGGRGDGDRLVHLAAGAPVGRVRRGRAGDGGPPGLGRRRAGRAGPRLPLPAGAGRGLPPSGTAVRRRARGRRGRRHGDDRRLRRAARRRRPPRRGVGRGDRRAHGARSRSPSRCTPSPRRPAPTRRRSSSAAATTTRCWRRSRPAPRCPRAGRSSAPVAARARA